MQIPVNQIVNVEPNNFQGLTKTTFLSSASNNQPVYMFHQPQNAPQPGTMLDGTIATDQRGALKFTKTPNPQYANQNSQNSNFQQPHQAAYPMSQAQSATSYPPSSTPSTDPRQESIEKQAYFKAAIDLYTLWKTYASEKTLEVFAGEVAKLALLVKRQMKDNANGDIIPSSTEVTLENLTDIFGNGTQEVLQEGPNGL